MKRTLVVLPLLLLGLLLAEIPSSWGQTAAPVPVRAVRLAPSGLQPATGYAAPGGTLAAPGMVVVPAAGDVPNTDPQAAAAQAAQQQRAQRLQAVVFDRRPSAILQAWSEAAQPDSEQPDSEPSVSEQPATERPKTDDAPTTSDTSKPEGSSEPASPSAAGNTAAGNAAPGNAAPNAAPGTGSSPSPGRTAAASGPGSQSESETASTQDAPGGDQQEAAVAAAEASARLAQQLEQLDRELKALQRDVTIGRWAEVARRLREKFSEAEAQTLFQLMVTQLSVSGVAPQMMAAGNYGPAMPVPPGLVAEQHVFRVDDLLGLAASCPAELTDEHLAALGRILQTSLDGGMVVEAAVQRFQEVLQSASPPSWFSRRRAAKLLFLAGQGLAAEPFVPTLEEARQAADFEGLNLLSQLRLAQYEQLGKPVLLEQAWDVTQAILSSPDVDDQPKEEALRRALDLAPRVSEQLGEAWLEASFSDRPERGISLLAAIGSQVATGLQTRPRDADYRLQSLKLQRTAVDGLLQAAPDRARQWKQSLEILAGNWLREAELSYSLAEDASLGPRMERDAFGNLYYVAEDPYARFRQQSNAPLAIHPGELLKLRPNQHWLEAIDAELRPKLAMVTAKLYLKVGEETEAFPYIADLAGSHPEQARSLANDFLDIWISNHDPNSARRRTNPYMYIYGFDQKAESIPLTRSKQERNLEDLARWVKKLRDLQLGELDEERLTRAFTTCHSSAEVYRLESIQSVFGSVEQLEPETLAALAQQMRANLNGIWRDPAVQKQSGTNRKKKDIEAEVQRGYTVARQTIIRGLEQHPDNWQLLLVSAALEHDANNYQQEISPSSEFTSRRAQALDLFRRAAEVYARKAAELREDEQSTSVYEQWFYASLGACDLQNISERNQLAPAQPALIREALLALPGEAAERHLGMFANTLFTRMSALNPAVKFRYLRAGFDIVGDHQLAQEAQKVYEYYRDLVKEIELRTVIDGSDAVGHGRPFGVFVNLRHTREIEREAGGFAKYTQNQNNQYYAYNYGRPLENYRDRFEEAARAALGEHFEVLSVTFNSDDPHSKATDEYGWRVTPYAYLLLQARGPEVDKLPALQLDLDFLDTSGYVVLPIASPALPLDARQADTSSREVEELTLTQTLDERQAADGKLILEIKAVGRGLIPELSDVVSFQPQEFDITNVDDLGVAVSRFDKESEHTAIISERTWLITLTAKAEQEQPPETFAFAAAIRPVKETLFQRYVDADLSSVDAVVRLGERYGRSSSWRYVVIAVVLVLATCVLAGGWWYVRKQAPAHSGSEATRLMPDQLTPFTVLSMLRRIERDRRLDENGRHELATSIARLERRYFAEANGERLDLQELAETWARKAR